MAGSGAWAFKRTSSLMSLILHAGRNLSVRLRWVVRETCCNQITFSHKTRRPGVSCLDANTAKAGYPTVVDLCRGESLKPDFYINLWCLVWDMVFDSNHFTQTSYIKRL